MPLGLTLLSAAYAPERRARALGIFSGVTGLAVLGGPVVGGAITQGIAWQWIFWINVPIGLLTIPVVLRRVDESHGPRSAPDIAGLALVTGAALGIVWGLVRGNSAGWGSVEVIAALALGTRSRWRSCCGSGGRRSRCCRWGCSPRARSRRATRRSSS